jgi:hypothetical protein
MHSFCPLHKLSEFSLILTNKILGHIKLINNVSLEFLDKFIIFDINIKTKTTSDF